MSEKEPKRRGRPRKSGGETPSQTETEAALAQPVVEQVTTTATEATVENPVEQATHRFMKVVYKEGADILQALSVAQDDLFSRAGVAESFQALYSVTTLGLEEARERNNQGLIETLTSRQRAFSSALKRLSPLPQVTGVMAGPTNPSELPPMVGRKG